jgi:hypothetical protein
MSGENEKLIVGKLYWVLPIDVSDPKELEDNNVYKRFWIGQYRFIRNDINPGLYFIHLDNWIEDTYSVSQPIMILRSNYVGPKGYDCIDILIGKKAFNNVVSKSQHKFWKFVQCK